MIDVLVCGHVIQLYEIYLDLVFGLRNIFLFRLTCTMLNYGLVCSWRSYSLVNLDNSYALTVYLILAL